MAMIGLGSPVPRVLPNPDGTFNTVNDRYMLMFQYPLFAEAVAASGASSGGRPWPQRTLNILMPKRVMQDDEDILLVLDD